MKRAPVSLLSRKRKTSASSPSLAASAARGLGRRIGGLERILPRPLAELVGPVIRRIEAVPCVITIVHRCLSEEQRGRVDTMVAHLAGALGAPVWTLLHVDSDWRWMLDRSDSPWYPTMRLFRQNRPGDWDTVLDDVAAALPRLRSRSTNSL